MGSLIAETSSKITLYSSSISSNEARFKIFLTPFSSSFLASTINVSSLSQPARPKIAKRDSKLEKLSASYINNCKIRFEK